MVSTITDQGLDSIEEKDEQKDDIRPQPPDRHSFQHQLGHINREITYLKTKVHELVDYNGNKGLISLAVDVYLKIRGDREQLAKEAAIVKKKICEEKKILDVSKNAQFDLERHCRIRSMDKADKYLKENEARLQLRNMSIKEEQLVVSEIDALKRNKLKLEKLDEVKKERAVVEARINKLKQQNEATYQNILKLKGKQEDAKEEQRDHRKELEGIRKELMELYRNRDELIKSYNEDRETYGSWMKSNRKEALSASSSYPATFPLGHRVRNSSVCLEDEELEPFFEQKRDCRRLISFLERLLHQLERKDYQMKSNGSGADSDSADDFPASFANLSVLPEGQRAKVKNLSRKVPKKEKSSQPISFSVDIYNLFGSLDVEVAKTYADIPRVLNEVKQQLAEFEQQTNDIDWNEELRGLGGFLTVSRTTSEFTGDSAYIDSASENASVISFRNRRSSVESPANVSQHNDDGLSSMESEASPIVLQNVKVPS